MPSIVRGPIARALPTVFRMNSNLSQRRRRVGFYNRTAKNASQLFTTLTSPVASSASVSTANYLGENIVFDSSTNKYWWIFQDASGTNDTIRLASSPSITSPVWTVEASPVISEAGVNLECPHIVQDNGTWYIFYGRANTNVYCQKSSTVNSGYSATGITNPQIDKGTSGTWEDNRVFEPYVFKWNQTYVMLYMAENVTPNLLERTGVAFSDSITGPWAKSALNPVIPGNTATWNAGQDRAADPFAIKVGDYWYVGTTATSSGKANWVVGFYLTYDFVNYSEVAGNPILNHGGVGTFDSAASFRGAISNFGGTYYFPYTGVDGSSIYRLGLTTLTFS